MPAFCVKCKGKTNDVNPVQAITKNGRPMIKSVCGKCGSRKSEFVSMSGVSSVAKKGKKGKKISNFCCYVQSVPKTKRYVK